MNKHVDKVINLSLKWWVKRFVVITVVLLSLVSLMEIANPC
jgi:hypothetical protein